MPDEERDWELKMTPSLVASVVPNRIQACDAYLIIIIDDMQGKNTDNPEKAEIEPHIYSHGFSIPDAVIFLRDLADSLDGEDVGDASGGIL